MATKNGIIRNKVEVGKGPSLCRLVISEIVYLEGCSNYTLIYTAKKVISSAKTLLFWQGLLGDDFSRLHRKYLVNNHHVLLIESNQVQVSTGKMLKVSRRRLDILKTIQLV